MSDDKTAPHCFGLNHVYPKVTLRFGSRLPSPMSAQQLSQVTEWFKTPKGNQVVAVAAPTMSFSELVDFDDGDGPVPAHRHNNVDGTLGGWVADSAFVAPTAKLGPNAVVFGHAQVSAFAAVLGEAKIHGCAVVTGRAQIFGCAEVSGEAQVDGRALVHGEARIFDRARIARYAQISGDVRVCNNATVTGKAAIFDHALVYGNAVICGDAKVGGHSQISGSALLSGDDWLIDEYLDGTEEPEVDSDPDVDTTHLGCRRL